MPNCIIWLEQICWWHWQGSGCAVWQKIVYVLYWWWFMFKGTTAARLFGAQARPLDRDDSPALPPSYPGRSTQNVGAVGCLRRVKGAASVARAVLNHTRHTLLVGELATQFAVQMGFKEESLETEHSRQLYQQWQKKSCQPNFWMVRWYRSVTGRGRWPRIHERKKLESFERIYSARSQPFTWVA